MPNPEVSYQLGKIKQAAAWREAEAARLAAQARKRKPRPNLLAGFLAALAMLLSFMLRLGRRATQARNNQTFLITKSMKRQF